jgi:hypothetical protein
MEAEKRLARQDADYAINRGNNNETSIKITDEIRNIFLDAIPEETMKKNVTFFIHKEDFIKSACGIISSLPLYDKHGDTVRFKIGLYEQLMSRINQFFGEEAIKPYTVELLYNKDRNSCLQGLNQSFNIRAYMVESWSTIRFSQKKDGIHMELEFSKSNEPQKNDVVNKMMSIQQIYYGAPGTGKSYSIDSATEAMSKDSVFRTTFHPDSDYSSFVGAYKPTTEVSTTFDKNGKPVSTETKVIYKFVKQTFLKAYLKAWQNLTQDVALVIEEINRGNCAQIFGDLFQLLDRKNGFSDYPIDADDDLRKALEEEFSKITLPAQNVQKGINELYAKHYTAAIDKIWKGEILVLPSNLYIWATMNTSDQSLFPIDSAFKRRWDWKYVKISDAGKNWQIRFDNEVVTDRLGNKEFYSQDWWAFIEKINIIINNITDSADKQLGYFFCSANRGIIDAETFVSKVVFYLWNDVFKNYGYDDPQLFGYTEDGESESKMLAFPDFYDNDGNINEHIAAKFIDNIMSWSTSKDNNR